MLFHYVATETNGKIIEDEMDASDAADLLVQLGARGLRPIHIKAVRGGKGGFRFGFFGQRINIVDRLFLTKYLSLMLQVGTDLFKAIDILIEDFEKPALKSILMEVRENLQKGQPFYTTFAQHPKFFSPVFVNLVKAGESSGTLDKVLKDLSASLEREEEVRSRVRSALVYPILLIVGSFMVLFLLTAFALPRIADVFAGGSVQPPAFSRVVFAFGAFVNRHFFVILFSIIGVIGFLLYLFMASITARRLFQRLAFRLPIIGGVLEKISLQRFASTFASLLRSGLPITDALEITADAVGWEEGRAALLRISREGLTKGVSLGDAFRREEVFPKVVTNLVAISEKAGHLDEVLQTLADFYGPEIDSSIKTLLSFLEPILLLFIGAMIGTIALSIIVPIYQLTTSF